MAQHGEVLARSGGENSFCGFPPETPDAHFAPFARGFFALLDENLLHFGAEVAAEFRGQQAEEHAVAFRGGAFGFGHDVPRVIWTIRSKISLSLGSIVATERKASGPNGGP